jgi:peptide/nickel transport system substrate-binding protein
MRQLDRNHPCYTEGIWAQSTFAYVRNVEALDRLTVRITLEKPYAPFLSNLAMIAAAPIVCPNAVRKHGQDFKKNPVGTGPLAFAEWIPGDRIILKRNPFYWGTAPEYDTLVFRSIINNRNRLNALKAGVLHGMDGVDYEIQRQVARDDALQLISGIPMNVGYMAMNTEHPPFDSVLVRRAVNHAINKQSLVKLFYQDLAVIAKGPLPPGMLGYDPDQPDYEFDPAQARRLMEEAGYASGVTARLWTPPVPRPAIPEPMKIAMSIQASLANIGIRLEIVSPTSWREYLDQVNNGEHDACLLSWMGDNGDPDNFLYPLLDLDNAVKPKALNRSFFRDQAVHRLLLQAQQNPDPDARAELYGRALLRIHDQAPWVPIAHAQTLMAVRSDLEGCEMTAFNLPYLANARRK